MSRKLNVITTGLAGMLCLSLLSVGCADGRGTNGFKSRKSTAAERRAWALKKKALEGATASTGDTSTGDGAEGGTGGTGATGGTSGENAGPIIEGETGGTGGTETPVDPATGGAEGKTISESELAPEVDDQAPVVKGELEGKDDIALAGGENAEAKGLFLGGDIDVKASQEQLVLTVDALIKLDNVVHVISVQNALIDIKAEDDKAVEPLALTLKNRNDGTDVDSKGKVAVRAICKKDSKCEVVRIRIQFVNGEDAVFESVLREGVYAVERSNVGSYPTFAEAQCLDEAKDDAAAIESCKKSGTSETDGSATGTQQGGGDGTAVDGATGATGATGADGADGSTGTTGGTGTTGAQDGGGGSVVAADGEGEKAALRAAQKKMADAAAAAAAGQSVDAGDITDSGDVGATPLIDGADDTIPDMLQAADGEGEKAALRAQQQKNAAAASKSTKAGQTDKGVYATLAKSNDNNGEGEKAALRMQQQKSAAAAREASIAAERARRTQESAARVGTQSSAAAVSTKAGQTDKGVYLALAKRTDNNGEGEKAALRLQQQKSAAAAREASIAAERARRTQESAARVGTQSKSTAVVSTKAGQTDKGVYAALAKSKDNNGEGEKAALRMQQQKAAAAAQASRQASVNALAQARKEQSARQSAKSATTQAQREMTESEALRMQNDLNAKDAAARDAAIAAERARRTQETAATTGVKAKETRRALDASARAQDAEYQALRAEVLAQVKDSSNLTWGEYLGITSVDIEGRIAKLRAEKLEQKRKEAMVGRHQ